MRAHGEKGFQIYCTTATLIGPDRQGADNHATDGATSAIPRSSCERLMTLYRISKTEDPKRSIPPPAEPRLRTKSPRELYISICLGKLGYEMHRILLTPPPKYLQYKDPYIFSTHAPCCFLADSSYYLQEYKYNPLKTSQWRPRRS